MTDDPTTPDVPDQPDERDERVAALLEVPPLDDVTRRRLVSRALEAADEAAIGADAPAPAPRGRRILAVAAGTVAVLAIGAGVISALRDDGGSGSTAAARRDAPERQVDDAAPGGGSGADSGTAEAPALPTRPAAPLAGAVAAPIDLGDLGDVGDTARLRATVRGALAGGDSRYSQRLDAVPTPCLTAAPAGTSPVAVASGRDRGEPVVVLVVAVDLDRFRLLVLDPTTCAVRSDVEL